MEVNDWPRTNRLETTRRGNASQRRVELSECVCAVGVLTRLVWCGLLSVVSRWAPPAGAAARRVGGDVAPAGDGVSTGHGPGGDDARGDRPGRRAGQAERPCH